jgi:hypothetical protein
VADGPGDNETPFLEREVGFFVLFPFKFIRRKRWNHRGVRDVVDYVDFPFCGKGT